MGFIFALASRSSYGQMSNMSHSSFDRLSSRLHSFDEVSAREVNAP
jgi:hypothetical protein